MGEGALMKLGRCKRLRGENEKRGVALYTLLEAKVQYSQRFVGSLLSPSAPHLTRLTLTLSPKEKRVMWGEWMNLNNHVTRSSKFHSHGTRSNEPSSLHQPSLFDSERLITKGPCRSFETWIHLRRAKRGAKEEVLVTLEAVLAMRKRQRRVKRDAKDLCMRHCLSQRFVPSLVTAFDLHTLPLRTSLLLGSPPPPTPPHPASKQASASPQVGRPPATRGGGASSRTRPAAERCR